MAHRAETRSRESIDKASVGCEIDVIHMLVMGRNFFRTKISLRSCYCLVIREASVFNSGWEIGLWGSLDLCQFLFTSSGRVK